MLVLTRRVGEGIVIPTSDGVVEIKVGKCTGSCVKLLIESPLKIKVLRSELTEEKRDELPQ